jgi:hypothetical protein
MRRNTPAQRNQLVDITISEDAQSREAISRDCSRGDKLREAIPRKKPLERQPDYQVGRAVIIEQGIFPLSLRARRCRRCRSHVRKTLSDNDWGVATLADVNLNGGPRHPQHVPVTQRLSPDQDAIVQSGAIQALQIPNTDKIVLNCQGTMMPTDQGACKPEVAIVATTD